MPRSRRGSQRSTRGRTLEGWTIIVEVRGYRGGARVNDLQRLGRFTTRFAAEHRRMPERQWYVVNHFVGATPNDHPLVLAANSDDVATFAEHDGLAVDTAELLRLWMAVQHGGTGLDGRTMPNAALRRTGRASTESTAPPRRRSDRSVPGSCQPCAGPDYAVDKRRDVSSSSADHEDLRLVRPCAAVCRRLLRCVRGCRLVLWSHGGQDR
jgi:hypothetical protein